MVGDAFEGKKFCGICKQWLNGGQFYKSRRENNRGNRKDGLSACCKKCNKKKVIEIMDRTVDYTFTKGAGIALNNIRGISYGWNKDTRCEGC